MIAGMMSAPSTGRPRRGTAFAAWIARAAAIVLCAARVGSAQPAWPAAGGLGDDPASPSHGWTVVPSGEAGVLLHLPPRSRAGSLTAADGAVRLAERLVNRPEAIAAWGDRVYLVFPPVAVHDGRWLRRVLTTGATATPVGDLWVSRTGDRLDALPALPGDDRLAGFVAARGAVWALLRGRDASGRPGTLELRRLGAFEWASFDLPASPFPDQPRSWSDADAAHLIPAAVSDADVHVVVVAGERAMLWRGVVGPGDAEIAWTSIDPGAAAAGLVRDGIDTGFLIWREGELIAAARLTPSIVEVRSLATSAGSLLRIARLEGVPGSAGFVPMDLDGSPRLAVLWTEGDERARAGADRSLLIDPAAEPHQELREVSLATGRILYAGRARPVSPVSPRQYRLLIGLLVGTAAVVLVVLVSPDRGASSPLPDGVSIARAGKRVLAGMIDWALGLVLAGRILGVSPWSMLAVTDGEPGSAWLIPLSLVVAAGPATLGEWIFGRSLGKWALGCRVIDLRGVTPDASVGARPSLAQAAIRNAVRWLVPPVAVFGLADPDGRHRGDRISGTAVVEAVEEDESDVPDDRPGGDD